MKKIIFFMLIYFIYVTSSIHGIEVIAEDTSSTSQSSTNNLNSLDLGIPDRFFPNKYPLTIEYSSPQVIGGFSGTKFKINDDNDYLLIVNHNKDNNPIETDDSRNNNNQNFANNNYNTIKNTLSAFEECVSIECNLDFNQINNLKNLGISVNKKFEENNFMKYELELADLNRLKNSLEGCDDGCDEYQKLLDEKQVIVDDLSVDLSNFADPNSVYTYVTQKCSDYPEDCENYILSFTEIAECANSLIPSMCKVLTFNNLAENAANSLIGDLDKEISVKCDEALNYVNCYEEEALINLNKNLDLGGLCVSGSDEGICAKVEIQWSNLGCDTTPESFSSCISLLEDTYCEDMESDACNERQKFLDKSADLLDRLRPIETTTTFDIINAVLNPDQAGLDAAALFGFEAKYDKKWQLYDSASYVCLAKYGGYLDTQEENQVQDDSGNSGARGITQYGCTTELELGFSVETGERVPVSSIPCREVLGDLRAERTPLLPDETVQITYSGYLRAPPSTNISYMLYAVYQEENKSTPILQPLFVYSNGSLNPRQIDAGQDKSFYNTVRIPEGGTLKNPIGEEGVKILLQSYFSEGSTPEEYVTIITPAYEITASSYRDPLGQQSSVEEGNSNTNEDGTSSEDEEDTTIEDDEILEQACKILGTC